MFLVKRGGVAFSWAASQTSVLLSTLSSVPKDWMEEVGFLVGCDLLPFPCCWPLAADHLLFLGQAALNPVDHFPQWWMDLGLHHPQALGSLDIPGETCPPAPPLASNRLPLGPSHSNVFLVDVAEFHSVLQSIFITHFQKKGTEVIPNQSDNPVEYPVTFDMFGTNKWKKWRYESQARHQKVFFKLPTFATILLSMWLNNILLREMLLNRE